MGCNSVIQWYSKCLAFTRSWFILQSHISQEEEDKEEEAGKEEEED